MADEEQRRQQVDLWQRTLVDEDKMPLEWKSLIYEGIVDAIKKSNPKLRGLPTDLISRMMMAESTLNPEAVSKAGAVGLMQVKPSTAEYLGMAEVDLTNPKENILAGMTYLHYLLRKFGELSPALEAYNVGPTAYRSGKRAPEYLRKLGR